MGFWEMVAIGAVGTFFSKMISSSQEAAEERERKRKEEEKRKNTPCYFEDGISEEQFKMIVKRAGKPISRLTDLSIEGPVVYGTVCTNSGINEWNFEVDFNDYGHITGKYWLSTDNEDSSIPKKIAEKIKIMIHSFPEGFEQAKTTSKFKEHDNSNIYDNIEFGGDAKESLNSKKIGKQAKESKSMKDRIKKKIIILSWILLFSVSFSVLFFLFYKYKEEQKYIEVGISSFEAVGQDYEQIVEELKEIGFINIHANPEYDLEIEDIENENMISRIEIHGDDEFYGSSKYPYDTTVKIFFHAVKNIYVPISAKEAKKINFIELETMLRDEGFINVSTQAKYDLITGWITKDGTVEEIFINGETGFSKNSLYRPDAEIKITYHTFKKNKD